jgi:hypothetical protein
MPLYTFYLCQTNGDAWSFETFDLDDDLAAGDEATVMLRQHQSAAYVAVWCGEQKVCTIPRNGERSAETIRPGPPLDAVL